MAAMTLNTTKLLLFSYCIHYISKKIPSKMAGTGCLDLHFPSMIVITALVFDIKTLVNTPHTVERNATEISVK